MAVFVNAPGEDDDWLIDGGGDWSGGRVVVPFLRAEGVDRLNAVVLTRGDKAHAAGLGAVMEGIPFRIAIHGGTGSRSKFFWNWLEQVRRQGIKIVTLREDDSWRGRDLRAQALNPPPDSPYNRSDDNALVLLLESGPTRVLLMSDAGATVERRLLERRADVRAQIIIKGRHSEEPSCTDAFLGAVQPAVVIQCVGAQPSSRYLEPELRDRLRQRGIAYYRTDETGAVTVRLTKTGWTIRTWNPQ